MKEGRYLSRNPTSFTTPELQINSLGCSLMHAPGEIDLPEGMDDYLLMFFHEPLFVEDVEGWLWREAPCLMVWPPDSRIHFGHPSKHWGHSWVDGDGPFFRRQLKKCGLPVGRVTSLPDVFSTEKYLLDLRHELGGQTKPHPTMVRNILQNMLLEIGRICLPEARDPLVPRLFMNASGYFKIHFNQPLRIADVARHYNLSVPYFCRQFKRYFGISALDYLTQVRMQQAETMLRDHQFNVSQVAEAVGYRDPDQFTRIFKRHYGLRPSDIHRWAANNLPGKRAENSPWERKR